MDGNFPPNGITSEFSPDCLVTIWKQLQKYVQIHFVVLPGDYQLLDVVQVIALEVFYRLFHWETRGKITMRSFLSRMEVVVNPTPAVSYVNSFDEIEIDIKAIKEKYETQTRTIPGDQKHLHFVAMCNAMVTALHGGNVFQATETGWLLQCIGFCCELCDRFLRDVGDDILKGGPSYVERICNGDLSRIDSVPPQIEIVNEEKVVKVGDICSSELYQRRQENAANEGKPVKKKRTSWKVKNDEELLDSCFHEKLDLNLNIQREKRIKDLQERTQKWTGQQVPHSRVRKYLIRKENEKASSQSTSAKCKMSFH